MPVASNIVAFDPHRSGWADRVLQLTFSGNYPTGGDTVDFTSMTNTGFIQGAKSFSRLPTDVSIENMPDGYLGEWISGTTLANGKLKIYTAEGTELGAGAYPAALTGGNVKLRLLNKVNI